MGTRMLTTRAQVKFGLAPTLALLCLYHAVSWVVVSRDDSLDSPAYPVGPTSIGGAPFSSVADDKVTKAAALTDTWGHASAAASGITVNMPQVLASVDHAVNRLYGVGRTAPPPALPMHARCAVHAVQCM